MQRLFLLYFLFAFLSACHEPGDTRSSATEGSNSLPPMEVDGQAWGADFSLHIARVQPVSQEVTVYTLLSQYSGKPVGFYLYLRKPKSKRKFVSGVCTLRPMADTSNNFLAALAGIYRVWPRSYVFADSVVGEYINLNEMPGANDPGSWTAAQTKLFFGDGSAELYMNIDLNSRTISFPEKDSAYRADLIAAFLKH